MFLLSAVAVQLLLQLLLPCSAIVAIAVAAVAGLMLSCIFAVVLCVFCFMFFDAVCCCCCCCGPAGSEIRDIFVAQPCFVLCFLML